MSRESRKATLQPIGVFRDLDVPLALRTLKRRSEAHVFQSNPSITVWTNRPSRVSRANKHRMNCLERLNDHQPKTLFKAQLTIFVTIIKDR